MKQNNSIWLIFGLWAALCASSIIVAYFTEPTGDSFARGLNRVVIFFQFQTGAAIVAILAWWFGRASAKGSWQWWLSRLPVFMAVLLFVLVVGTIAFTNLTKPDPAGSEYAPDPVRPVTAVTEPVDN